MATSRYASDQFTRTPLPDVLSGFESNPNSNPTPTISDAIPGLESLSQSASSNIGNLLEGLPSAPWARTQNAYWGAGAGQPGGGQVGTFIGNRGADLYHTQSQTNQQAGLDNLLKMIQGYSGTVASTPGQIQQASQFDRSFAQQQANDLWNQLFQEKQLNFNQDQARNKNGSGGVGNNLTYNQGPGSTFAGATAYPFARWS